VLSTAVTISLFIELVKMLEKMVAAYAAIVLKDGEIFLSCPHSGSLISLPRL
jgi:hypothetical protein